MKEMFYLYKYLIREISLYEGSKHDFDLNSHVKSAARTT